jgi:hypothetical protein
MIPKNFCKDNFTPARAASLFHCCVWFDIEQREPDDYTSWRNEIYPVNAKMKVISHASAYKGLRDMIDSFLNPAHKHFRRFTRAEIYENFFGTTLFIHDGLNEIKVAETFRPVFATATIDKLPGKHRLITGFQSTLFGEITVDRSEVLDHARENWKYWHGTYKNRNQVTDVRKGIAA